MVPRARSVAFALSHTHAVVTWQLFTDCASTAGQVGGWVGRGSGEQDRKLRAWEDDLGLSPAGGSAALQLPLPFTFRLPLSQ